MSRWTSYLQRATELVETYRGDTPLAPVLKEYFRARKQMGSTDRRWVSDLVYGYYRLGHAGRELPVEERLLLGYLLTHREGAVLLEELKPSWAGLLGLEPSAKLAALGRLDAAATLSLADIFPWQNDLSRGIDPTALALSHLQQPAFFIRLRPGRAEEVRSALGQKGVAFEETDNPDALRIPAGAALQDVLPADTAYVVQDLSSQRVGDLFREALGPRTPPSPGAPTAHPPSPRVWDCCAASGGKSILLKDLFPDTRLTVSDLRPSILHNLEKRFAAAGIRYDRAFAADLTKPLPDPSSTTGFDLVLADVPCSGSGTWSRTPEQLYFFTTGKIAEYARLQRGILSRVAPAVKSGGYLLLVTCSVFAEENESNVAFLTGLGFETRTQQVFTGYDRGADTLFGALLRRP